MRFQRTREQLNLRKPSEIHRDIALVAKLNEGDWSILNSTRTLDRCAHWERTRSWGSNAERGESEEGALHNA